MKYDIFISYRRDGGDTLAQLIYDRLTDRGYRVFLDIESLRSGKFNEKLFSVISECKDVIVILPPGALERCRNEGDWLFLEVSHALKERKNIIPVMMKGFEWPDEIPEGLEELQNFNGIQDSKDYFDAVIDKMTMLLHSRAALLGTVRKKRNKKKPHLDIKTRAKRMKKLLAGLGVTILAIIAILFIPKMNHDRTLQEAAENYDIMIYPSDEMSASEYYDAQETLRQRFELLSAGKDYDFSVEDDTIHVTLSMEVFHESDPEIILNSYITRPTKLSVIGYADGDKNFLGSATEEIIDIDRADIKKVEIKTGTSEELRIERIDNASYGLEEADEYKYVEITFSDEICSRMRDLYGEHEVYCLGQDVKEVGQGYYYYYMMSSDSENVFYLIDNYQDDNIYNVIEFNYQHEPFSKAFTFNILTPVEWERMSVIDAPGENQCDVWELQEPYITMQFETWETDIKQGELQDYMSNFKQRLDALDMPYSFGSNVDSEWGFSIRTGIGHMGQEITDMLLSYAGLSVEGIFYDVIDSYYIEDLEYEKREDGTYLFSLVVSDVFLKWNMEEYETAVNEISASDYQDLYLVVNNDIKIAKADVQEDVQGVKITFDNLYYLGIDEITDKDIYILNLLKELAKNDDLSSGSTLYDIESSRVDGEGDNACGVISLAGEILDDIREKIQAYYPEANVARGIWADVEVALEMEADEELPRKANEAIQQIYSICGLEKGKISSIAIDITTGDDGYIHITIEPNRYSHFMGYSGYCSGEAMQPYEEEFNQILQTDPFYTDTIKMSSDTSWTNY